MIDRRYSVGAAHFTRSPAGYSGVFTGPGCYRRTGGNRSALLSCRGLALLFLDAETVLIYPEAFQPHDLAILRRLVPELIEIDETEACDNFACNAIVVNKTIINNGCGPELRKVLEKRGFEIVTCDLSEFHKSGAGARCLALNCYP